jgi:hypothetical protein
MGPTSAVRFDRGPVSEHSNFIPTLGFIHNAGTGTFSAVTADAIVVG